MAWFSILSGLLLTAAFAPFSFFPAAIIAVAGMLSIWLRCRPRQAARCGYLFGLSHFGSSIYWIYFSLYDYGGASAGFSLLATALLVGFLALYYAGLAYLVAYTRGLIKSFLAALLLYPSLWVLCEYLRSVLLTGFPWNLLGQSIVDSPFTGVLPIFGVFGASWVIVFIAVGGRELWCQRGQRRLICAGSLTVILVLIWASGFIEWTETEGDLITAGIVQSGIPQGVKFDPEKLQKIIETHRDLTAQIADSDLVLWSETAIPVYYHQIESKLILPLYRMIVESGGGNLLLGAFVHDRGTGTTYNSIVNVDEPPQIYHKRHLVPFGEYVPLRSIMEIFSRHIMIPMSDLASGTAVPILRVGEHQAGVSICYEVAFGHEFVHALPAANYLVNVSNDSWFGDSVAPHQHLQIARLRTLETGRDMIRATSTGISAMISHKGVVLAQSKQFERQVLVFDIQPRSGMTPYAWWNDWAILIISTILIFILIKDLFLKEKLNRYEK